MGLFGLITTIALVRVGDLGLDVRDVGVPAVGLVAQVVDGRAAAERRHRSPQRVVRCRDEHFVAVVEQRLHRHGDEFGDAVAEVDVVDVELGEARDQLVAGDDRAPRRQRCPWTPSSPGRAAATAIMSCTIVSGASNPNGCGVADVELEDAVALGLEPRRMRVHRSADLVQHVLELGRLLQTAAHAVVKLALFLVSHGSMVPPSRKPISSAFSRHAELRRDPPRRMSG